MSKDNRGVSLTTPQRVAIYTRMNGRNKITPRQRRRINHKANHQLASFGKKADA